MVAAYLQWQSPAAALDEETLYLRARGWLDVSAPECKSLAYQHYYELESMEDSAEIFVSADGNILGAKAPLPEPPYSCRPIPKPNFIQEI